MEEGQRIVPKRCRSCFDPSFWLASALERVKSHIRRDGYRFWPLSAQKLSPPKKSPQFLFPNKISCRNFANRTSLHASQIKVCSILDILMPRKSLKAHFLNHLQTAIDHVKIIGEVHQLFFVGNSNLIYLEQAAFFKSMHNQLSQCWYLFRISYHETNYGRLHEILFVSEEELTARFHTEFLLHSRVSHQAKVQQFFEVNSFTSSWGVNCANFWLVETKQLPVLWVKKIWTDFHSWQPLLLVFETATVPVGWCI